MHENDLDEIAVDDLPEVLREIAEATDLETALLVAEHYGGRNSYFPTEPKADHWLAKLVGHEKARLICDALTPGVGMDILVPMGPMNEVSIRKRKIWRLIMEGLSSAVVAKQVGVHTRTIYHHRKRMIKAGYAVPVPRKTQADYTATGSEIHDTIKGNSQC